MTKLRIIDGNGHKVGIFVEDGTSDREINLEELDLTGYATEIYVDAANAAQDVIIDTKITGTMTWDGSTLAITLPE